MRARWITVAAATVAIALTPAASSAKTCSSGFKHAVIAGSEKCLRAGEFCARRSAAEYRSYGYKCFTASGGRARLKRS